MSFIKESYLAYKKVQEVLEKEIQDTEIKELEEDRINSDEFVKLDYTHYIDF